MIEYSLYTLAPLKRLNSQSTDENKQGLYLRLLSDEGAVDGYADYFPHVELGDLSVDEILSGKRDGYFEKCLWFAKNAKALESAALKGFKNHLLSLPDDGPAAGRVIKMKVNGPEDFEKIKNALKTDASLRLDANACVSLEQWKTFFKGLSDEELDKIEYVEDPGVGDWRELPVASAKDFMESTYWNFEIYKANARFCDRPEKAIFSSCMGSDLGRYHCYLELVNRGDLGLVHGIHTPGIYREQLDLFKERDGLFYLNQEAVEKIFADLKERQWTTLG